LLSVAAAQLRIERVNEGVIHDVGEVSERSGAHAGFRVPALAVEEGSDEKFAQVV
jgi:hypothetical protein